MTRRFPLYILALSILSCAGCSRFEYDEKLTVNKEAFSQRPPRSLAVLPFANAAKVKKANELAREQIYAHLAPLNYQDTELSKVDTTLSNLSVRYQLEPDEVPPPLIRRSGLADAILSGNVVSISKRWALFYSHIRVVLDIQLTDSRTNEVIYHNVASGRNSRFTAPTSILDLFSGAWDTILHLRDNEVDETMEDLSEHIAKTFPNPSYAGQEELNIRDAKLELPRNPMQPGDILVLEFLGTPDRKALVDIGTIQVNAVVPEVEPGKYQLRYRIPPGTKVDYAVMRLRLLQEPDRQVEVTLYNQPFSVMPAPVGP